MKQGRHCAARAVREQLTVLAMTALLLAQSARAGADTFDTSTRAPGPAELAQFQADYSRANPGQRPPAPTLKLRRADDKQNWRMWGALAEWPARRGMRALCIVNRTEFSFDTSWKQEGEARQYVWLEQQGCTQVASAVEVMRRLPESDIVELLEQQGKLLASARLLFAGNTGCARQRALNYVLKAIDLGAISAGGEEMAALVYHDDRGGAARVWARRSGADYTAWNVACGPLPSTVAPQVIRPGSAS